MTAGATLLAATAALTGPARAPAAEVGVVSDLTWYISDSDKQRSAAALQDLGSRWARLHVQWREAEPARGQLNEWWMAEYAEAIAIAHDAGQRVIVMVYNAPAWASGSASSNVPRAPADFADFLRRFASRFSGQVEAYEVWNEPNISRFWSSGPDPGAYARLLAAAYRAVKAADPDAEVVFGGVSGNDYRFVEAAYAAGAGDSFDVMATHPYTYCGSSGPAAQTTTSGRPSPDSFLGYREVRQVMLEHGDAGKPIWFTEFGWNSSSARCDPGAGMWQGGVSEADQATYLTAALRLIEADPYVTVALWYSIRDPYWLEGKDDPEANTGLMRRDFSAKPAYAAFRAYANGTASRTRPAVDLRARSLGPSRIRLAGAVSGAVAGAVRLVVERKLRGSWRRIRARSLAIGSDGRFHANLWLAPRRRSRARVRFGGNEILLPARSPWIALGG